VPDASYLLILLKRKAMLDNVVLENILVFDIETVPQYPRFSDLPPGFRELWEQKGSRLAQEGENVPSDFFYERAGIYAEFGKVICISAGYFKREEGRLKFRIKSFASDNEKEVLSGFKNLVDKYFNDQQKHRLCGHNIREFDIPYLCRRMLINGLQLQGLFDISGKKSWDVQDQQIDTFQLWKFGDFKNYTSLKLLAHIFNIPTPKDDIDGSDVARVYWVEKNLPRIVTYCQKDVVTVAQLLLKFKGLPLMQESDVAIANSGVQTLGF
jgi:DNA polymerase elongation subunit (family B)